MENPVGEGITVGVKTTIEAPDGIRIESFGVKIVPGGIALGMQTSNKVGERTDYAATLDTRSVLELVATASMYARKFLRF